MGFDLSGVTIKIESAAAPPITLAPFAGGADAQGPGLLERLVQPKVTVLSGDTVLYTVAPAGDPPDTPWTGIALLGLVLAGAVGLFMLGRISAR